MTAVLAGLWLCAAFAAGHDADAELFTAVLAGDMAGIEAALAAGADVNARRETHGLLSDVPERGFTPLMVAARGSELAVLMALLAAGANPNLRGSEYGVLIDPTSGRELVEYRNPLLLAAEHNPDPEVSLALVRAGAWPDATTTILAGRLTGPASPRFPYPVAITHSFSPIGLALERNANPGVATALKELALTYRFPDLGWTEHLLYAAKYRSGLLVSDILDSGVNIDTAYERLDLPREPLHTVTALHAAVESGNFDTARTLIESGADVDALAEEHGYTPLVSAVLQGSAGMIELLLNAAAASCDARHRLRARSVRVP